MIGVACITLRPDFPFCKVQITAVGIKCSKEQMIVEFTCTGRAFQDWWVVFLELGVAALIVIGRTEARPHGRVSPNLYRQLPVYGSGILHSGVSPE